MVRLKCLVLGALGAAGLGACSSSQGGEGQACYPNGTCNAGLTCLSKLCVNAGSPDGGNPDAGNSGQDGGNTPDAGPPSPPALGTAIDRAGRPGINNLLNHAFDTSLTTRNQALDSYNAAAPAAWPPFEPGLATALGYYDALDGTCENQLLAASPASATSYQRLGNMLVDDRLYLNTGSSTCQAYLGVELNALGVLSNSDCGGLTPLENAIDVTFSLLVTGQLNTVSNGVTSDADATASTTAFPYLAAPH
jgi:hypothetical protein